MDNWGENLNHCLLVGKARVKKEPKPYFKRKSWERMPWKHQASCLQFDLREFHN